MIGAQSATRIVRESTTAAHPLLSLRAEGGGTPVEALVAGDAVHLWQDTRHVEFARESPESLQSAAAAPAGNLTTVLPGVVVGVLVSPGERVAAGQPLLIIEAMKMEHAIRAPRAGVVRAVRYRIGERVKEGSTLAELDEES
jgi:biotin carboxyl carrier protein